MEGEGNRNTTGYSFPKLSSNAELLQNASKTESAACVEYDRSDTYNRRSSAYKMTFNSTPFLVMPDIPG